MCSKRDLDVITSEVIDSYRRVFGSDIVKIVLYGSYARGNYDEDSDIDYVAIVSGDRLDLQERVKQVWNDVIATSMDLDVIISPTVVPFDEFEKYKYVLPYYRNIEQEGISVG